MGFLTESKAPQARTQRMENVSTESSGLLKTRQTESKRLSQG